MNITEKLGDFLLRLARHWALKDKYAVSQQKNRRDLLKKKKRESINI